MFQACNQYAYTVEQTRALISRITPGRDVGVDCTYRSAKCATHVTGQEETGHADYHFDPTGYLCVLFVLSFFQVPKQYVRARNIIDTDFFF